MRFEKKSFGGGDFLNNIKTSWIFEIERNGVSEHLILTETRGIRNGTNISNTHPAPKCEMSRLLKGSYNQGSARNRYKEAALLHGHERN